VVTGNFSGPDRDSPARHFGRLSGVLPFESLNGAAGSCAVGARWFRLQELPTLACDQDGIVAQGLRRVRNRNHPFSRFALLPERFTLSRCKPAVRRSSAKLTTQFHEAGLDSKLLMQTDGFERGSHRPARPYQARFPAEPPGPPRAVPVQRMEIRR
jgi:hypothetical protein